MVDNTKNYQCSPESPGNVLEEILRKGAREMLQGAISIQLSA